MILDFLLFPIFIFLVLSLGTSFDHIISRIIRYKGRLAEDISILGFFGIFFLGIMGVVANFFMPLSSNLFLLTIAITVLSGSWMLVQQRVLISKSEIMYLVIAAIVFVPLASSMMPGYDAGLYHLPHQLWLRQERIVIGLAHFHDRFGFSSLLEYVYAPLWINDHFKLLSYSLASIGVFFLSFLVTRAGVSKGPTLALIIGVIVNLTFFNEYLIWLYTFTDVPAGFLFTTAFVYGFWMIYTDMALSRREWTTFSVLLLFALLIKASTVPLVIWGIFVLAYLLYSNKVSMREVFLGISIPLALGLIWLLRSVMVSGCLLFPAEFSCIGVPWAATGGAENSSNWVTAWARHPGTGLYSLEDVGWFLNWWLPNYSGAVSKFLLAGSGVILFYVFISTKSKFRNLTFLDIRYIAAALFSIIALAIWFWKSPDPRFGIGPLIIFIPVLFVFILGKSNPDGDFKQRKSMTTLFSIALLFSINTPWEIMIFNDLTTFDKLSVPVAKVKKDTIFGLRPIKGDQCWVVPECSPYNHPNIQTMYGLRMFLPE